MSFRKKDVPSTVGLSHKIRKRDAAGGHLGDVADDCHPEPIVDDLLDELARETRGQSEEGRIEPSDGSHDCRYPLR